MLDHSYRNGDHGTHTHATRVQSARSGIPARDEHLRIHIASRACLDYGGPQGSFYFLRVRTSRLQSSVINASVLTVLRIGHRARALIRPDVHIAAIVVPADRPRAGRSAACVILRSYTRHFLRRHVRCAYSRCCSTRRRPWFPWGVIQMRKFRTQAAQSTAQGPRHRLRKDPSFHRPEDERAFLQRTPQAAERCIAAQARRGAGSPSCRNSPACDTWRT